MNADGTVDGIIFADLAFSKSVTWGNNNFGTYSYTKESNLKEYYIKEEDYTDDFGTKDVIAPVSGTTGNDRFYIMALDDFTTTSYSTFYWYYNAYGNMSDYSTATSGDFGTGKSNTIEMISKWNNSPYGEQNAQDMWGVIQNSNIVESASDSGKWFIASRAEWSAFAGNLGITESNYFDYGLRGFYWSSLLDDAYKAYTPNFLSVLIDLNDVWGDEPVRYAATF